MKILLCWLLATAAFSADKLHTVQAHSEAHLVLSHVSVPLGGSFRAGIFVEPDEGWHVYWSNPGDSGAPPSLKWTVPKGIEVGPIDFPTPVRFEQGGLFGFGYKDGVLYSSSLHVPQDYRGKKIPIVIQAEWLVCKGTCIPARFRFEGSVKIGEELLFDRFRSLFDRFLGRLPTGKMPVQLNESATQLDFALTGLGPVEVLDFFPDKNLEVELSKPVWEMKGNTLQWQMKRTGINALPERLGLLVYRGSEDQSPLSVDIVRSETHSGMGLWEALLFALMGGMLLNLMPCVFPVLSIKVLSLSNQSGGAQKQIRKTNLVYASGIIVALTLLGFVLASLRSAGEALGWGFQLQTPWFLAALTYLFSLMGFVYLGSLDLSRLNVGYGQSLASKEGYVGEFFSGFLCVLVASPCTAPLMGAALGFAVTQPLPLFLAIFISLGVGLASPYLVLSAAPRLVKFLPRPGAWMETLKEAMAFPLFLTVLWLIWVYGQIQGQQEAFLLTVAHLCVAMAVWAGCRKRTWVLKLTTIVLVLMSLGLTGYSLSTQHSLSSSESSEDAHGIVWQNYDEALLAQAAAQGKPVFVDFTADWCLTCKVNERLTFSSRAVKEAIEAKQIQMFRADWTKRDPTVTRALEKYGRIGVPFYVAFTPKEKAGKALGEVMTPDIFLEVFQ